MHRIITVLLIICTQLAYAQTTNLVSNGNLSNGTTGWTLLLNNGNVEGSTGAVVNGEYKVTIAAASSLSWHLQLTHAAINLIQGNEYILSFDAYAAANRSMIVNVSSGPNAYTSYSGETTFDITTVKKRYTTTFTMGEPSNINSRLEFNLALSNAAVYIDNVSISLAPKDTVTVFKPNFPFPHNALYPYGIKPTNFTQYEMNIHCREWYDKILAKYVTNKGCAAGQYRYQRIETGDTDTLDTVSEGIGYGMLVLVYMENDSTKTKKYFDGMFKYYEAHLDGKGLMNWRINKDGTAIGTGAATDADLDVAYALFMAHKQWGSAGPINYLLKAKNLAGKILAEEITATNDVRPGDGWDIGNISYFTPAYFKIFTGITGEARWTQVAGKTYQSIVNSYYNSEETYNAATGLYTGLMPNWCSYDGQAQSPGVWAMDVNSYWWDACRFPWRQGYDYLLHGTANSALAQTNTARISKFFKKKYEGNASLITSHYKLNGEETIWSGSPNAHIGAEDSLNLAGIVGSTAIAAMVDGDQVWLNTLYERLVQMPMCETNVDWGTDYFNDILKMIYLQVLTGNQPDFYTPFNIVTGLNTLPARVAKNELAITIYSGIQSSNLHIEFTLPAAMNVEASIMDLTGKIIANEGFTYLESGTHQWYADKSTFNPGIYLVMVKTPGAVETKKMIIYE